MADRTYANNGYQIFGGQLRQYRRVDVVIAERRGVLFKP